MSPMDQLTSSLGPPRAMQKSAVADPPPDVAGSVTKRSVFTGKVIHQINISRIPDSAVSS